MGRSRDVGDERFATVTEAAEALGVTGQAIYNRIKAETIPYEQHIDETTGRPSYRIPRAWVEAEAARKASTGAATSSELAHEGEARAAEIIATLIEYAEAIRGEIEIQHTKLEPLLEKALENQARILGRVEVMGNAQDQTYKLIRRAVGRLEEADRREREYQQKNLELQQELTNLVRQASEENRRARSGSVERRAGTISRRTVYILAAVLIASVWVTTALLVWVHVAFG